jgi:ABC-type Fe3+/spermidine/putrescine transport system ATPase subunit
MADRIVILDSGRIAQAGPPEEVYNRPASPFVADFLGAENKIELEAELERGSVAIAAGVDHAAVRLDRERLPTAAVLGSPGRTRLRAFFRGEAAELVDDDATTSGEPDALFLDGRVTEVSYPGGLWRHEVRIGDRSFLVDAVARHQPGSTVRVRLPAEKLFLYPAGADVH